MSLSLVSYNENSAYCTYLLKSFPKGTPELEDVSPDKKDEITPPPGFPPLREAPPSPIKMLSSTKTPPSPLILGSPMAPPSPLKLCSPPSPKKTSTGDKEICVWFLNGNCRFGSRCRNRHEVRTPQNSRAQYDEDFPALTKTCELCLDTLDSPISSIGSESDFELDSNCDIDDKEETRFPGVYVVVDGQLQFVPDVSSSDPDLLVCWDFNTKFGCTYPGCTWEHKPCQTTKAHPTKFGRICTPEYGLRNLQKEHDKLMEEQKRKMENLGFL